MVWFIGGRGVSTVMGEGERYVCVGEGKRSGWEGGSEVGKGYALEKGKDMD